MVSEAGTDPTSIVEGAFVEVVDNVREALPAVVSGLVFLLVAGACIVALTRAVRAILRRLFPGEEVYVRFAGTVVSAVLWFSAALAFLSLVGLTQIAAALGTASGFVALGVAYALSGMIADLVAGVYLLRDPDFNPGDRVHVGDVEGTVESIELRKTRLDVEGDRVVRANAEIEKKWTRRGGGEAS